MKNSFNHAKISKSIRDKTRLGQTLGTELGTGTGTITFATGTGATDMAGSAISSQVLR